MPYIGKKNGGKRETFVRFYKNSRPAPPELRKQTSFRKNRFGKREGTGRRRQAET